MIRVNKDEQGLCITGGFLIVIGLVALYQKSVDGAILLMGLGLVLVAVGLGKKYVAELFETFKDIFVGMR